jgi:phage terminase large subunit-like protein
MEAPAVADITDREMVREALLVCRGDSVWLDVDRLLDEISDPTTPEWESRRYYLNEVVAAGAERWIPAEFWEKCIEDRKIPDHTEVTLGFDGSFKFDATALVVVQLGEVPHLDVVQFWERADSAPPDWEVPIEEVEEAIREACRRWKVRNIACDPYLWARSLQILANERLPVEEYPQTAQRMIPATTRFREAVMNGQMTHSGNPDLARHVENAVLKIDSRGGRLSKDSKHSPRRIDLAVASVMAFDRASIYEKKKPRIVSLSDALRKSEEDEAT